jgi:CRP/FNR family transcriptional regulator, nitrogen fixation regulation protein
MLTQISNHTSLPLNRPARLMPSQAFHSTSERKPVAQTIHIMGVIMSYPRNAEIFGENEAADYVYKVVSGSVRTYKILSDGRRQIGGFYLPGDIFGFAFANEHSCSAEAISRPRCWSSSVRL